MNDQLSVCGNRTWAYDQENCKEAMVSQAVREVAVSQAVREVADSRRGAIEKG